MDKYTAREKTMESEHEIQDGKFFAAISYISFLCVAALLFKKYNKFAVYHAKQGLVIFVLEIVGFILSIIPSIGGIIGTLVIVVFGLLSIWGIIQSLLGNYFRIPLVSDMADSINL